MVKTYPPALYCNPNAFASAPKWEEDAASNGNKAIVGHIPLPKGLAKKKRGLIMMRNPIHRLRSAFPFKHAVGMNASSKEKLMASVTTVEEYVTSWTQIVQASSRRVWLIIYSDSPIHFVLVLKTVYKQTTVEGGGGIWSTHGQRPSVSARVGSKSASDCHCMLTCS